MDDRIRDKTNQVVLENENLIVTKSRSMEGELGVLTKRPFAMGEVLFVVRGRLVFLRRLFRRAAR